MLIGASSDWHLTEGDRFDHTLELLHWIAEDGRQSGVKLWALPGDFAGTTCPHRQTPKERNGLVEVVRAMAESAPVVMLYGNHDFASDLDVFGKLEARHPIRVLARPEVLDLTQFGQRGYAYCMPWPSKRFMMAAAPAAGSRIDVQKDAMEWGLRAILDSWRMQTADRRVPHVFVGHFQVAGSKIGGDEILIGQEVELSTHDLDETGCGVAILGHIHRHQQLGERAWYCGSPARQNWGEESFSTGYLLVDAEPDRAVVTYRETPARRMITVRAEWGQLDGMMQWTADDMPSAETIAGADVRLRVTVAEEAVATCPTSRLVSQLVADGAYSVKTELRVIPKTRVRSETISDARSVEEKVRAFFASLGSGAPGAEQQERALGRLGSLGEA